MPIDTSMFDEDINYAIDELPVTFTFENVAISGSFTDMTLAFQTLPYGLDDEISLSIIAMRADFPTVPVAGELLTYNSIQYRIVQVVDTADQVSWTLNCVEKTKMQ